MGKEARLLSWEHEHRKRYDKGSQLSIIWAPEVRKAALSTTNPSTRQHSIFHLCIYQIMDIQGGDERRRLGDFPFLRPLLCSFLLCSASRAIYTLFSFYIVVITL